MEIRREDRQRIDRLTAALERVAGGIEKAVELAQEEETFEPLDTSLPTCPVCHEENPMVIFNMPGGQGRLSDFALTVDCKGCRNTIYGIPLALFMSENLEEIRAIQQERKAGIS